MIHAGPGPGFWRSACLLDGPPLPTAAAPSTEEPRIDFYLGCSSSWLGGGLGGLQGRGGAGLLPLPSPSDQLQRRLLSLPVRGTVAPATFPLQLEPPTSTMPGVPGPGPELATALEERLSRALEELQAVAEAGRAAVTQAAQVAVTTVEPVARAAEELRAETAALSRRLDALGRQVEVLSLHLGVPLVADLEPDLEPSELFLAAADPEALFEAAEDAGTPVAHPPAFSTRRRSSSGPSRSSSLVSHSESQWKSVWGGGVWGFSFLPLLCDLRCSVTFSGPQFSLFVHSTAALMLQGWDERVPGPSPKARVTAVPGSPWRDPAPSHTSSPLSHPSPGSAS